MINKLLTEKIFKNKYKTILLNTLHIHDTRTFF